MGTKEHSLGVLRTAVIGVFAILPGCGSNDPAGDSALARKKIRVPDPVVVTTTPSPTPSTSTVGYSVPADIADNFPTANAIEPFDNGGSQQGAIAPISGDAVGAFRTACPPTIAGIFDPMVGPAQRPFGHTHVFGVNDSVDQNSTYATLRTTGGGCGAPSSIGVYRSAFWMPAMLDGVGNAVLPDFWNIYYKQIPNTHPDCKLRAVDCVNLPNGLSFISGYNMATGMGGPMDSNDPADPFGYEQADNYFECWTDGTGGRVAGTGRYQNLDALKATLLCTAGNTLMVQISAPECWDGKNADSADHRSHLSEPTTDWTPPAGYVGGVTGRKCPAGYYLIPKISVRALYLVDANFANWSLSCDAMTPGKPRGTCLHFDYKEAWSPTIKQMWWQHCINEHRSCSSGDLGNGTQIKGLVRWPVEWKRGAHVPVSTIN